MHEVRWPIALGIAWLGGSLAWTVLAAWRIARFARAMKRADAAPGAIVDRVEVLSARLGLRRPPRVVISGGRVSPMVWALLGRATLVVPRGLWQTIDDDQRDALLIHELAHLRRGDHRVRLIEMLATGLYWWHPALWWARRELHRAEEACCDLWVVWAMPGARKTYATALVAAVEYLSSTRPVGLPAGASGMGQVADLSRRLGMILKDDTPRGLSRGGILTLAAVALLLLPWRPSTAQEPAKAETPKAETTAPKGDEAKPEATTTPPGDDPKAKFTAREAVTAGVQDDLDDATAKLVGQYNLQEIQLLTTRLKLAEAELAKAEQLHQSGSVSEAELSQAKAGVLEIKARLAAQKPAPEGTKEQVKILAERLDLACRAEERAKGLLEQGAISEMAYNKVLDEAIAVKLRLAALKHKGPGRGTSEANLLAWRLKLAQRNETMAKTMLDQGSINEAAFNKVKDETRTLQALVDSPDRRPAADVRNPDVGDEVQILRERVKLAEKNEARAKEQRAGGRISEQEYDKAQDETLQIKQTLASLGRRASDEPRNNDAGDEAQILGERLRLADRNVELAKNRFDTGAITEEQLNQVKDQALQIKARLDSPESRRPDDAGDEAQILGERLKLAQATLERYKQLRQSNAISESEVDKASAEVLELRARIAAIAERRRDRAKVSDVPDDLRHELERAQERLKWSKGMAEKQYVSPAQVQADEAAVDAAKKRIVAHWVDRETASKQREAEARLIAAQLQSRRAMVAKAEGQRRLVQVDVSHNARLEAKGKGFVSIDEKEKADAQLAIAEAGVAEARAEAQEVEARLAQVTGVRPPAIEAAPPAAPKPSDADKRIDALESKLDRVLKELETLRKEKAETPRATLRGDLSLQLQRLIQDRTRTNTNEGMVLGMYSILLGHPPSEEEMRRTLDSIAGTRDRASAALKLICAIAPDRADRALLGPFADSLSKEQGGSPAQWADRMYEAILDRAPSREETDGFVQALGHGEDRREALLRLMVDLAKRRANDATNAAAKQ